MLILDEIRHDYAKRIERFVRQHGIPVHRFDKGTRKDDETQRRLRVFAQPEGVLNLGTAQEKFTTVLAKVYPITNLYGVAPNWRVFLAPVPARNRNQRFASGVRSPKL